MRRSIISCTIMLTLIVAQTEKAVAEEIVIDGLQTFVCIGIERDPRFNEKKFLVDKTKLDENALRNSLIIPKLEISAMAAPAPQYTIKQNSLDQSVGEYDFSEMGPFLGGEIKLLQPLNFRRMKNGLRAASKNYQMSVYDFEKAQVEEEEFLQELYFKYLYARHMVSVAQEIKHQIDKAVDTIQNALDEDDESVSQSDMLELKCSMFKVEDGCYQAECGLKVASNAVAFTLQTDNCIFTDTVFDLRSDPLPVIDSLKVKLILNHPDLKKLFAALEAQKKIVSVASGELFPDVFVAGNLKLSKAWNDKGKNGSTDEDIRSPYNKKEGSFGVGLRYNLNLWAAKDKYKKEKLNLEALQCKAAYAKEGLIVELVNQYEKVCMNKRRVSSAESAFKASEALLKSAAMKYDIDKKTIRSLVSAFEKNIQAKKDYYECILDYNISVAMLYCNAGLTVNDWPVKS